MSGYSLSTVGILSRQGCPTKRGGKNHLIGIVEKRLRAQFEAAGVVGYTEAERELRVSELTKQRRRLVAECELYQRTLEQAGLTVTRPISPSRMSTGLTGFAPSLERELQRWPTPAPSTSSASMASGS